MDENAAPYEWSNRLDDIIRAIQRLGDILGSLPEYPLATKWRARSLHGVLCSDLAMSLAAAEELYDLVENDIRNVAEGEDQ